MNVLAYTTATPNPCDETLHIPPGKSCLSKSALHKLVPLELELNKNNPEPIPTIIDEELLPSDGSSESNMIRRLAAALNTHSEYALLNTDEVQNILTETEIKTEKNRFKVKGPRLSNVGTDGDKHAYRTLMKWAELFDFFYPLPHAIYAGDYTKNKIDVSTIMDIVEEYYPEIRLIAAEVTILIGDENKCGHAIVILIDMRGQKYENWTVEYFDSSGAPPVKEFIPLLGDIASALRDYRKKLKQSGDVKILPVTAMVRHQLTTTECGMHALIYIRRRLEGISAEMFSRYKIPDALAKGFRRDIFVE